MTDKELLYAQDVFGHYQHFLEVCQEMDAQCCNHTDCGFVNSLAEEAKAGLQDLNSLLKRYGG